MYIRFWYHINQFFFLLSSCVRDLCHLILYYSVKRFPHLLTNFQDVLISSSEWEDIVSEESNAYRRMTETHQDPEFCLLAGSSAIPPAACTHCIADVGHETTHGQCSGKWQSQLLFRVCHKPCRNFSKYITDENLYDLSCRR